MTRVELQSKLDELGVYPQAYSLNGGLPNERYVLNQEPKDEWQVYYSERGQKSGLRVFQTESAACEYFLQNILEDPLTRRR